MRVLFDALTVSRSGKLRLSRYHSTIMISPRNFNYITLSRLDIAFILLSFAHIEARYLASGSYCVAVRRWGTL